jgi:hypothetical protein
MKISKLIEMYDKGMLTKYETLRQMCRYMTSEQYAELDIDWKLDLKQYSARFPDDESSEWDRVLTMSIWCGNSRFAEEFSQEKLREEAKQGIRNIREIIWEAD